MTTEAQDKAKEKVRDLFAAYLETNNQRRTPERFAILDEIYMRNDHFDAEELYIHMRNEQRNISKATVYNTLELLVNCDLVKKHQFGQNLAQYEKAYGFKQHDHLICVECKKVIEFCDPRIQQIKTMVSDMFEFEINHHSLNLYGECKGSCEHKAAKNS